MTCDLTFTSQLPIMLRVGVVVLLACFAVKELNTLQTTDAAKNRERFPYRLNIITENYSKHIAPIAREFSGLRETGID